MAAKRIPHEPDIRTVYLGQFPREEANRIAGELESEHISWWYKDPGFFSQIWEYGVRMFVDGERLAEAREIVARIEAQGPTPEPDTG